MVMTTDWASKIPAWRHALVDRVSTDTANRYLQSVQAYLVWVGERYLADEAYSPYVVDEYLTSFGNKRAQLVPLNQFYKFVTGRRFITEGRRRHLPQEKVPTHIPSVSVANEFLDHIERFALSEAPNVVASLARVRLWAIAELIYGSGITLPELCNLKVNDLDTVELVLDLGDRRVPVTSTAMRAVALYRLMMICYLGRPTVYLFTSTKGAEQLDTFSISTGFQRLDRPNIPPLAPKILRQAFGQHLLDRGFPKHYLSHVLGASLLQVSKLASDEDNDHMAGDGMNYLSSGAR
jgi:site-specific recombinase XerD